MTNDDTLSFNTIQYLKAAREAGFTEQQAEVNAETFRKLFDTNSATKDDIKDLRHDITIRVYGTGVVVVTILASIMHWHL